MRGLDRLVFFSDAVVAIAITLVVLPLVDSAREVGDHSAAWFLHKNADELFAAGISFAVIGVFWRNHHALFVQATGYTPLLLRVNFSWLAGIVCMPLVTVLDVTGSSKSVLGPVLYLVVIGFTLAAAGFDWLVLARAGLLGSRPAPTTREVIAEFSDVGLIAIAIVIVLIVPGINLWPLWLLVLQSPANRFILARARPRRVRS